jgi:hypothetical protein
VSYPLGPCCLLCRDSMIAGRPAAQPDQRRAKGFGVDLPYGPSAGLQIADAVERDQCWSERGPRAGWEHGSN